MGQMRNAGRRAVDWASAIVVDDDIATRGALEHWRFVVFCASMNAETAIAWLVPLSGPPLEPIQILAAVGAATLGRGDACTLRLPADADKVSRQHARFSHDEKAGNWRMADMGSRWGTFLNGVKLTANRDVPLGEGDLVRIMPWTFHFSLKGVPRRGLLSEDDSGTNSTLVRSYAQVGGADAGGARSMAEDLLALLLETAAAVHAAESELALAEALIDGATRGTGLSNAAVLRPLDAAGRLEVIASRQQASQQNAPPSFSRSLLAAASQGVVAELSAGSGGDISQSIVQMGIRAALCVPLMLGGAVAAYLYLDSRGGGQMRPPRAGAAPFCLALGRMAGLALANLKRVEIEKRQAALEYDLSAAATAHKWILPQRITRVGAMTCTGESRAGAYVGGDFFDVIPLDEHRMAVALGDVTGHGVAASVLMTAAQGFLNAALRREPSVARAVTDLNRFVCPRRPPTSFMTLWVGVFDAVQRTVTYVNAAHGYAMIQCADGSFTMLDGGEDLPIGFDDQDQYTATTEPLPAGGRTLILSDGIIEQYSPGTGEARRQFDFDGVKAILASPGSGDVVADLFAAVVKHAESSNLQDDATAVVVTW
jgi:serine phosphatase RsbU (regulator of sigma subunit)/pSer/pThr/pTyr-binding forkhead associated (FHA) protein